MLLLGAGAPACAPMVVDAFEPPIGALTCPAGSLKTAPGSCGCEIADEDFDADGTADCLDRCPDNADGTAPSGACGCSSYSDASACGELRAALRNLYTFGGSGTEVIDSVGDADGSVQHMLTTPPTPLAALQRSGRLVLDGQGSYVDLPDGMISTLGDATFEAWVIWRGGDIWARIFDFGDNGGTPFEGVTYLFLTSDAGTGALRAAYSLAGPGQETIADGTASLPVHSAPDDNAPDQVAVVIDRASSSLRVYANGLLVGARDEPVDLGAINDVNNWLGRSNYFVDPPLSATLIEFRVYSQALTPAQIDASYQAGPGALD